jgi:stearoyl-CoA 9-desaturase NADPH oxidoreductase
MGIHMAEVGAKPKVPAARRRALKAMQAFFTPLLPDDYLELINPLWSTREMRGRVEHIKRETPDTVTITIRPSFEWEGHEPGQYLRVGVVVDGVHHWRAYSLTSDPGDPRGFISITPKTDPEGKVSPYLNDGLKPGDIVRLGGVEGEFKLPDSLPEKLLFISAGSGITPIMSMLRCLDRRDGLHDVVHIHSAKTPEDVIFGDELRALSERCETFQLHERHTTQRPRLKPEELDELCPDWTEREAFVCGPGPLIDAMTEHWEQHGDCDRLHYERFQPIIGGDAGEGKGGVVRFLKSDCETECDGGTPILEAGEEVGLELDYGCRMGICHTCTGKLKSGQLRDLRSGKIHGTEGETVRICIAAPEGDVELEL